MMAKSSNPRKQDDASLATLEKLLEVGQSLILVRDLEPLLEQIVESAGLVLGADVIVLYEYHEDQDDVTVPPVIWGEVRHPEIPRERGRVRPHKQSAVFKILARTEPFYATDAQSDWEDLIDDWHPEGSFLQREHIASSAAVPLIVEKQRVGVLFVNYRTPHTFTEAKKRTIELFATQAAIAIQNARFLAQERALSQQAEALRDVSGAITSAFELQKVGQGILEALAQVVEYRKASAQLIRGDVRTMIAYQGYGEGTVDEWLLRPVSQDRLVSEIVETRNPMILSRPEDHPAWGVRPGTKDVRSWVGLPLVHDQEVIGLLTLDHDEPGFYTAAVRNPLVAFARKAAIDIHNAHLFDIARRRIQDLEFINEVVQIINTRLDADDILQAIVSQIAIRLDCAYCTLFEFKEEERRLVPQITYGADGVEIEGPPPKLGQALAGRVLETGESLLLHDVTTDHRFAYALKEDEKHRSMLAAPVKTGDQTIGVILVDQEEFGWLGESDRRLVDALAQQAGIAIERATGLDLLRDIGNQIISSPYVRVDEILRQIVAGAIRLTNTSTGVIYLLSEDGRAIVQSFEYPRGFNHPEPRMDGEGGVTRQIVANGEVMAFPHIRQDPLVNPVMHKRVASMIGIPLKLEEKVIGVLYLNDTDPHDFTETEISMLLTLASQAAIAIKNAELFDASVQQAEELAVLYNISAQLTTLNQDELLPLIVEGAMNLTSTTSGVIYLLSADGTRILKDFAFPLDFEIKSRTHTSETGLTRLIFDTGKPVCVTNAEQDERVDPAIVKAGVRSFIGQPLKVAGEVIGVLYLNDTTSRRFDEAEKSLASALADQAAAAIQNARLFENAQHRIRDLTIVNESLRIISTKLETHDLLQTIVELIAKELECTHCTIFFPKEEEGKEYLRPQVTYGARSKKILTRRFELEEGIVGWVFQHGQSVVLEDATNDSRFAPARDPSAEPRSMLVVPVKVGDQTIGIISADQDEFAWFDESDRQLVDALARQAGIAIERSIALNLLQDIGNRIISLQDVGEILQEVVAGANRLTNTTSGVIYLLDEAGRSVVKSYSHPVEFAHPAPRLDLDDGLTRQVFKTGETMVFPDMSTDEDVNPVLLDLGVQSMIAVPMKIEGRVIGVLYLNDDDPHDFTETELSLLSTLVSQAAIAIENARLYQQRAQDIASLQETNEAITKAPWTEIARLIARKAQELTQAAYSGLWIVDGNRLVLGAMHGREVDDEALIQELPIDEDSISGWVALTGEPYIAQDVTDDPHYLAWQEDIKSSMAVPLKLGDRLIGTLCVESTRAGAFSTYRHRLLQSLADQAAIALENARMFKLSKTLSELGDDLAELEREF